MSNEAIFAALSAAVVGLFGVIVAGVRVAWVRLFDGDKGLVTRAMETHIEFVQQTASTNKHIDENTTQVAECLRIQAKELKDLKQLQAETLYEIRKAKDEVISS